MVAGEILPRPKLVVRCFDESGTIHRSAAVLAVGEARFRIVGPVSAGEFEPPEFSLVIPEASGLFYYLVPERA